MDKIYFTIALHFHQPIGNFDHIFERAYKFCYKPFFQTLSNYPETKINVHLSGCLLDYLHKNHPQLINLIKKMVSSGQIEIMTGAYYEPILVAISPRDIIGQIKMMRNHIRRVFGVSANGMWVAERVWHPNLFKPLSKAGIRYLILDDEHLFRSGVKQKDIHNYFFIGTNEKKIAVFPSDKKLRYLIPFKLPNETIDYLKSSINKQGALFTYGDDGEKFGEWPDTYNWVYKNKWLKKFFALLQKNKNSIHLVHLSEYLKKKDAEKFITIKPGSYKEMMQWSRNSWLNFISRYPESNQMHKKMLYISGKIKNLREQNNGLDSKKIEEAARYLYKGQCNCAYWHGVFGGLYLYHLRRAVYAHLIQADKIIDGVLHKKEKSWLNIKQLDYDLDSKREVVIENNNFSIYVDPFDGGVIKELDYKPLSFNLINTLSRKKEAYHKKILNASQKTGQQQVATIHDDFRTISPQFKNMLFYDKASRYFLRSYFVRNSVKLEDFISTSYKEIGDFSTGNYSVKKIGNAIILERKGSLFNTLINLRKQIKIISDTEIAFSCNLINESLVNLPYLLAVEFNITMPDLNSGEYAYFSDKQKMGELNTAGKCAPITSFGIFDNSRNLSIKFNFSKHPFSVFYYPVKTISQSERAYELNYQCSCILTLWKIDSFDINLTFLNKYA